MEEEIYDLDWNSIPMVPVMRLQCWPILLEPFPSYQERQENGDCDE